MSDRSLLRVALVQFVVATFVTVVALPIVAPDRRGSVLAGIAVVVVAMGIGFVPLRVLLRNGPEGIVAGWVAAMIVRMAATLVGLVLLIVRYRLNVAACVWTVCGVYLLLLIVEAIALSRAVRLEFEKVNHGKINHGEADNR